MSHRRLATVVLIGIAVFGVMAAGCGGTKREVVPPVSVPNLIGKNTLRAQALLRERGLRWRWDEGIGPGVTNGFIADTIEGQSPVPGGWVRPGTVVQISPGSAKFVGGSKNLNPYG
jgi:beta-lactam-binding protein with PASTA domain